MPLTVQRCATCGTYRGALIGSRTDQGPRYLCVPCWDKATASRPTHAPS